MLAKMPIFQLIVILFLLPILSGCGSQDSKIKKMTETYVEATSELGTGKIDSQKYIKIINNIDLSDIPEPVLSNFIRLRNIAIQSAPQLYRSWLDHGINIGKSIAKGLMGDIGAVIDPLADMYNSFNLGSSWNDAEKTFYNSLIPAGIDREWLIKLLLKYGRIKQKN